MSVSILPAPGTRAQAETRLADTLMQAGTCDAAVLERARRVATENRQALPTILLQLGLVSEAALATAYATLTGHSVVSATALAALEEPVFPDILAAPFLRQASAVPLACENGILLLAMADPLDDFVVQAVSLAVSLPVRPMAALPVDLEAALSRLYPATLAADSPDTEEGTAEGDPLEEDADRLKDLASEAPVIRLVNQIIFRAVETHASDIHFEPFEDRLGVRFRYDGVLHEMESQPARLIAAVISRIKIMARLDIAERRLPQDGRIKLAVRGRAVDFRVSTIPALHGESVVMRVLDRGSVKFEYGRLGLSPGVIAQFRAALEEPNGIVLVTGPTGSGKTTTLYTGLAQLNVTERKVVTIEDPIEYQLAGINQIQIRPQIGLTFATLLRAILRQDPDVIMVGEIRDLETAQIAAQAALTGHLVLSTLHTNSAAAAITRLRDMGLEDYLQTAVLRGVLAQRLVRGLCHSCRTPLQLDAVVAERLGVPAERAASLWQAVGCPECRHTGYRGRIAIAEYLVPSPAIVRLILARADHTAIERQAAEEGMKTLFQAGIDAACEGETTVEEVMRIIRAETETRPDMAPVSGAANE
ncbi:type II secretion system protein E [Acetobacter cibinongensis]|uniref:Secretion system type II kinase GspE n=1 Tax=Acetobacter cibinongensis TaxID=146475 RepID=A0A0D6N540_9PROT|nr:GspE/PulE family protein [Acetobacter cibinongensis]GAN60631.1 secretion system type II kinase GspE [Acetobacter cibinongensis]GBQ14615.1 general secretion pathway protein E [Acetobacter cibinongensis NRIC 0482]GEL59757.1 type II secretion system protein E [Acetobacter cibinongensis]